MKKPIIKKYTIEITQSENDFKEVINHNFNNLYELLGVLDVEIMRLKIEISKNRIANTHKDL